MNKHHAICPECTRIVSKNTEEEARDVVESHNDNRHGGDDVARVVGPYEEDLNAFVDYVRDEFDMDVFEQITSRIINKDPWGVLDD